MTLSQIQTFIVVSQTLNFTLAAQELGITQPAISTQIQLLEEELKTRLFNRVGRRVYLSQPGLLFLEHARQVLEKVAATTEAVTRFRPVSKTDPLNLGIGFGTGFKDDGPFLNYLRGTYKNATVQSQQALDIDLIRGLEDRSLDIAITQIPDESPHLDEWSGKLEMTPVVKTNILVVAAPHAVSQNWRRDPRILEEYPLVLPARHTFFRDYIDNVLTRLSLKVNISLETHEATLIRKVLLSGMGIGILPASSVRDELDRGVLTGLSVPELSSGSILGILTRKDDISAIPSPIQLGVRIFTSGWIRLSPGLS